MLWWWSAASVALLVAVFAGVADWRRQRRRDLDRIGIADWRGLQMFAVIAAAVCAIVANHG